MFEKMLKIKNSVTGILFTQSCYQTDCPCCYAGHMFASF